MFVNDTFTDTVGTALADHVGELGADWTLHPVRQAGSPSSFLTGTVLRPRELDTWWYASGVPAGAREPHTDCARNQADGAPGFFLSTTHDRELADLVAGNPELPGLLPNALGNQRVRENQVGGERPILWHVHTCTAQTS